MKIIKWLLLLLLTVAAVPGTGFATVYYVSASAGSNGNSCVLAQSISTPKQTILNAINNCSLVAGDTLNIRAGTYTDNLDTSTVMTLNSGVSFSNAITIKAYDSGSGPETVLIQPTNGRLLLNGTDYTIWMNLKIDAQYIGESAIMLGNGASHNRFLNCEALHGTKNAANIYTNDADFNEFIGGSYHDSGTDVLDFHGYGIYVEGDHTLVDGITAYNNYGGIQFNPNGSTILGGTVRNSTLYNNNVINPFAGRFGMILAGSQDVLMYNNLIYNNNGPGLIVGFSGGCLNCLIYNNTIYGNVDEGVNIVMGSTGTNLRNNIVYNNAGGTITNNGSSSTITPNFTTDPAFVSTVVPNFHLQSSSTAKTGGSNLTSSFAVDKDNVPRPQGATFSFGAYEFVGTTGSGNVRVTRATEPCTGSAAALTSPDWAQTRTSPTVNKNGSGRCTGSAADFEGGTARQISATFTSKHFSAGTFVSVGTATDGSSFSGATCLNSADTNANRDNYHWLVYNLSGVQHSYLGKFLNGTLTTLFDITTETWTNGDAIALECDGSTGNIWAFHGTGVVIAFTDTSSPLTTGVPGVIAAGDATIDDLVLGDINFTGASILVFSTNPASPVVSGATFGTDPVVTVKNSDGTTTDTSSTASITIALCAGSPAGTLGGTLTRSAVAGVIAFTGLSVTQATGGVGYTLCATSTGLTSGTSTAFNVTGVTTAVSSGLRIKARIKQ